MQRSVLSLVLAIALARVLGVDVTIAASGPTADLTRQEAGGGVTVTATLLTDRTDSTAIRLALNTHSVNLDGYQFDTIVSLRDNKGRTYALEAVESTGGSGHHREAVLRFARMDAGATAVELVVKNVAGVKERAFRWSMAN
jgi:hypothetical protein